MDTIKTVGFCPLGAKCREIKNDEIHECNWYVTLQGQDPQTGEVHNDKACALSWLPLLLIENSKNQVLNNAAIESFRNEMVDGQNMFNNLLGTAITNKLPK